MTQASAPSSPAVRRACLAVLVLGILVRLFVFCYLSPQNNDNHFEVVRYVYRWGRPADSGAFNQSYHPPLYYFLAAAGMRLFRLGINDVKAVQALSLLFSIGTLLLMHGLVRRLTWLQERFKPWLLALPALHPQFLIYTLFISNDTLAIFIGTLLFDLAERCLRRPTLGRQVALALALGAGLLTKFTFLAFTPPVLLLLAAVNLNQGLAGRVAARRVAALLLLVMALGCYKFVENAILYRSPFVSNLDFDPWWANTQRPTWLGPQTLLDVNVFKLVRNPVISAQTVHSWPLLIYGSLWYSYVPECNFRSNAQGWKAVGSVIDALALVPTLLMLAGAFLAVRVIARGRPDAPASATETPQAAPRFSGEQIYLALALLTPLMILLLVAQAGWKYDIWSVFQGRLLFPAYFALLLLLHEGLCWAARRRAAWWGVRLALTGLFAVFLFYLAVEFRLNRIDPVNPQRHLFTPIEALEQAPGK